MIKQDFYIANLIARYLSEEITPEETIKLTAWREESTAHEILFKKICDEENQKQHFRKNTAFNPSSGWKEVEKRIKRNNNRSRYIKIVSYAAIILLPVHFCKYFHEIHLARFSFGQTVHRTIHSTWGIPSYSDIGGRPDNPYK